jgi:hypothetical protein
MKKRIFLGWLGGMIFWQGFSQNSSDIANYIGTYKDMAIAEMQRSGVPASITLAQGIHETLAGTSELVRKSNNHFGIKCKEGWTGSVVYHDDDRRGECFRGYDNPQDSYRDHSDFLRSSQRYGFLFRLDPLDFESWARGLSKAGYATNVHYSDILIRLIRDYQLQQYSLIALGKTNPPQYGDASATGSPNAEEKVNYPSGEFQINRTRVIYAKSGCSLLGLAEQYGIPLGRLIEFNELDQQDILSRNQLIFLQRKRKQGNTEFHAVLSGEKLYDIAQAEGIRLESLLELNRLSPTDQPAPGEKIYLQSSAPARPRLIAGFPDGSRKPGQELILNKN